MAAFPDLTSYDAWCIRAQLCGALALLRDEDRFEMSDNLQTIARLMEVGIKESERLANLVDEYTLRVSRIAREQEVEA